ncbi:MAG: shikimate dehydrogenase [Marinilabiliaceae bacterium]|jgi:shikimate dehydrogenase|nr:shikimate dehydrogenase [Marinilabiliaceae bacterium]
MRKFGIIGFPLGHSFSKKYFSEKFEKEKINAVYQNYEISRLSDLQGILDDEPGLEGLNVTLPYKKEVIALLDNIDSLAAETGAVNVIKISVREGSRFLSGYNTDITGFRSSLRPLLKKGDKKALVLGTGGAALAAARALRDLDIKVTFVSRTGKFNSLEYGELDRRLILENKIIVNASPLGMYPETDHCPDIPYEYIGEDHLLYDLVYNPAETLFLKKGKEKGARVSGGMEMLLAQADEAWTIWNSGIFI